MASELPISVCVFTTSYPRHATDEAAVFIKNYIMGISQAGGRGFVLVPRDSSEPETEEFEYFDVTRFRYGIFTKGSLAFGSGIMPNIKQNPFRALQAPALLLSYTVHAIRLPARISVIHCNWAITALPAFLAYLLTGTPFVITLRGEDVRLLRSPFFKYLLQIPFRFSAAITSVNEAALKELADIYPFSAQKSRCIPNGVDITIPNPEALHTFREEQLQCKSASKIALFIGTVIPRKQVHVLLEAFSDERLQDWSLVIVGRILDTEYLEKITSLIESHALSERVQLTGPQPPSQIPFYLGAADAYVSASEHEGRPNSVIEAIAANLPLVLSDIEGHRELVSTHQKAALFEIGNPNDLAQKIAGLDLKGMTEGSVSTQSRSWVDAGKEYLTLFNSVSKG